MRFESKGKILSFFGCTIFSSLMVASAFAQQPGNSKICQDGVVRVIDGREFKLVWSDEFEGKQLNKNYWKNRVSGYGYGGNYAPEDANYLDGEGHLVMSMCALPKEKVAKLVKSTRDIEAVDKLPAGKYICQTNQLLTKEKFLYGYHEVRFKLPLIAGPGFCFWFPGVSANSTEIDVIEQTLYHKGKVCDYKSSTIHWYTGDYKEANHNYLSNQYQRSNESKAANVELINDILMNQNIKLADSSKRIKFIDKSENGLIKQTSLSDNDHVRWDDSNWHTAALLWTKDSYSFYYDGEFICKYDKGIEHKPKDAILSLRCMAGLDDIIKSGKGESVKDTPAKILVDYYRVYKGGETGEVLMPPQ